MKAGNRKLKFYSNSLVKWALKNGFEKAFWNGKTKHLQKDLPTDHTKYIRPYRIMILPSDFDRDIWRVEIWTPDIGGKSLEVFSVSESFIPETVRFMEAWFDQTI